MYRVSWWVSGEHIQVRAKCLNSAKIKRDLTVAYYIRQGIEFDISPHITQEGGYIYEII